MVWRVFDVTFCSVSLRFDHAQLNDSSSSVDGSQYGARLGRKRTVYVCTRSKRSGRKKKKKKKKTKATVKRKVGARIETQFDPRYEKEAPAEVGSPRVHLTWMRWQALSNMFSCTRALALSLIAYIMRSPRARGAFLGPSSPLISREELIHWSLRSTSIMTRLEVPFEDAISWRIDLEQSISHKRYAERESLVSYIHNNWTYRKYLIRKKTCDEWIKNVKDILIFHSYSFVTYKIFIYAYIMRV